MTTPRLGAPELTEGQAVPETTVNEQIRYMEAGSTKFIFIDRDLATPPGSPADGDCYLVAASPTGAWSGQAGKIAFRVNTAWAFITPIEGFTAWVNDENAYVGYDGAVWNTISAAAGAFLPLTGGTLTGDVVVPAEAYGAGWNGSNEAPTKNDVYDKIEAIAGGAAEATDSEMWTGSSTSTRVSPRRIFTAAAEQTLTDGATVTPDFNAGLNFKWTIGGNRTLANPSNAKSGQSGVIVITQDATGSRVISYGANWKFPGGAAAGGVLSTAANSVDVLNYFVRADGTIVANLSKAYS